jgi:signal transduction histidine kinase
MTSLLQLSNHLTSEQSSYVDSIKTCSDHLLVVINDILDFSKIEKNKLTLNIRLINLQLILEEAIQLAYTENSYHLDIIYLIEESVPEFIYSDSTRLRQILVNLLSNALRFTHQGGITINVKRLENVQNQIQLQYEIKDTG